MITYADLPRTDRYTASRFVAAVAHIADASKPKDAHPGTRVEGGGWHAVEMRRLTDEEFKATAVPEAERVGLAEEPPFDFWEYFEAILREDFGEHDFSEGYKFAYVHFVDWVGFQVLMPGSRAWLSRLFDDVADRDRLVAVGAEAALVEAGAGGVAVVAPLLGEVAGVAAWALIDGAGSSAGARRDGGGDRTRWRVAGAPGGLAAGGGAVGLAADRGERLLAGRAGRGPRGGDVVTDVVTRRWHRRGRPGSGRA